MSRYDSHAMLCVAALMATPAWGTIYYVSPTGSDLNAGTSPTAPWGSVAKVDDTGFSPGDQILFQYGSKWNAGLAASSSGSAGEPIVYGAYGNPALGNPTFIGSNPISTSAFTPVSGNTYQMTSSTPVNWVYDNNQFTNEALDQLTQASASTTPAAQLSYVENNPGSFYYNAGNGQLFVNAGANFSSQSLALGTRSNAIDTFGQSNLVFQNLNTSQTAQDNYGYGIRVENSVNVKILNSTVTESGKHGIDVIDTVGFTGTNLLANGSAPGQGFGGASAFVNYSDAGSGTGGTGNTAVWTNITYNNPNGAYEAYITHGSPGGISSITLNNITSLNGYGTGTDIEQADPNETVLINGGHFAGNLVGVGTNNSVVNGVTLSGPGTAVQLSGTKDVVQNSTFVGEAPNSQAGQDGATVDEGSQNTIRFNVFYTSSFNGLSSSIGTATAIPNSNIYGNILGSSVQTYDITEYNPNSSQLQSNFNLFQAGNQESIHSPTSQQNFTFQQWQALGYDLQSVIGTPAYANASAGIYMLQAGSPGIGLYTGSIDTTLTTANALLSATNSGSFNAGLNPSIWPNMNTLPSILYLGNGYTNTVTPQSGTLSITATGAISSGSTSTLNVVGNITNAGALIILGGWIQTGNVTNTGSITVSGSQVWAPLSTFTNLSGLATFDTDAGGSIAPEAYLSVNVSGGVVTFASTEHLISLNISSGAKVQATGPAVGGRSILVTPSLSISGTLDLTNNDLIVQGGNLAAVTALIAEGYNGGKWNGSGIASSAAEGDSSHLTALGVILNTVDGINPLYGSAAPLGLLDGADPTPIDVLVRYTYYGDTNLDGIIDGSDYARIDTGYETHRTGWFNGDFNYDGVVDGSDYTLIDNAFNSQSSQLQTSITAQIATSAVPEPAGFSIAALAASTCLRRRKSRVARA